MLPRNAGFYGGKNQEDRAIVRTREDTMYKIYPPRSTANPTPREKARVTLETLRQEDYGNDLLQKDPQMFCAAAARGHTVRFQQSPLYVFMFCTCLLCGLCQHGDIYELICATVYVTASIARSTA